MNAGQVAGDALTVLLWTLLISAVVVNLRSREK